MAVARIMKLRVVENDWRSVNANLLWGRLDERQHTYSLELDMIADRAFLEGFKNWLASQRVDVSEVPSLPSGESRRTDVVDGEFVDDENP